MTKKEAEGGKKDLSGCLYPVRGDKKNFLRREQKTRSNQRVDRRLRLHAGSQLTNWEGTSI